MNYLFPLIAAAIWGGNTIVTKLSAGVIAPAEIGFFRWLLAVLLLTPFVARPMIANWARMRHALPQLVALGLLGGAIYQCLSYVAAQFTTALHMGIIQAMLPLMAIGLTTTLLAHRLTYGAACGALVSLAGVVIVVSGGDVTRLVRHGLNRGDALMLVATLAYAAYTVLLKRWNLGLPLLQSLYAQAVVAMLALFPLYLLSDKYGITGGNTPLILYAALFASIVAPFVWMQGVNRLGPARISLFFNLVPVFTAGLAVTLLREHLTVAIVLGGGLTIAGVILAEVWRRPIGGVWRLGSMSNDKP
jgi:drug/metabolite transporter (DMT)-like permease